ncbi:hypothetical protein RCH18_002995 [Flavobacterium sp. PL11]|uniref:hypothetical protein n=1 Tax=Flavobacterium sp. PL11 TaxID=3071717 RepID=UPI002E098C97|nr:hypothetical protein [Flavobacterium sp. PL11]
MGLEIRHNRAENFHENTQFRRIALNLKQLFISKGWDGLLLGNPESEIFSRFRADAILLYNHGLLIIDLKDYQGKINLPVRDDEFTINKWYLETENDKFRLEIKGASFINPFIQLKSYRQVMYEVISNNIILNSNVDPSRVAAVNIFSGPIQLSRETPRNVPFYVITQESDLANFLYDYNSPNTYSDESSTALKQIFSAPIWEEHIENNNEEIHENKIHEIDDDLETEFNLFLGSDESEILVLDSMNYSQRDEWVRYIYSRVGNYNIPQTETWTHSSRIREKIKKRSRIATHSLYNTIYGGKTQVEDTKEIGVEEDINSENEEEDHQVVIPLKSDLEIDKRAVIILHEAHLVTRSLNESELFRFGSGRLLEDLLNFMSLGKTKRKLVCIGDPFFLSYGKEKESALGVQTLSSLFDGKIRHYRQVPNELNLEGKDLLRTKLALSINNNIFNDLQYKWEEKNLVNVDKSKVLNLLREWFTTILDSEPSNALLVYKNDDAKTTNLWIKENCLNNSKELSKGDLLLINNNVTIADDTGFGEVTRLFNGMYVTIIEILDLHQEPIYFKKANQNIILEFVKLKVKCLSLENKPETEVWLYNNYFTSNGNLSKEEQIAFLMFTNVRITKFKKENDFSESIEYTRFVQDTQYTVLKKEINEYKIKFEKGERVKTKLEELELELRKLERKYKRKYHQRIVLQVSKEDPLLNSIKANYGWCITVHKSVGSLFEKVVINAKQGDNNGITNESYYRWLYSGVSSSISNAYIINPQEISQLKDCQFEDLVDDIWIEVEAVKNNSFELDKYEIPFIFEGKINSSLLLNTKAAICIFSEFIEKHGFILEQTTRSGDYLSKATFSTPENNYNLVMVFNNNGKGTITSIRPEKVKSDFLDSIERASSHVWLNSINKKEEISFPVDFRKKRYEKWISDSHAIGAIMNLIESHSYQDIFIYSINLSKIKFRVNYDLKGFFTKITVLSKTGNEVSNNLKNLLFYGD